MEWHPTHPTTLAVSSKGGDIYLYDFKVLKKKGFIQGVSSSSLTYVDLLTIHFKAVVNSKASLSLVLCLDMKVLELLT